MSLGLTTALMLMAHMEEKDMSEAHPDWCPEHIWSLACIANSNLWADNVDEVQYVQDTETIARGMMDAAKSDRENFFTMQGAAATLLKRAEKAEEALAFVRRWAWEKDGNGTSEAERFSAIKHHPMIKNAGNNG